MALVLIDGDILIYKAACGAEQEFRWPDGVWTYWADEELGKDILDQKIEQILKDTKADDYIICLSDPEKNFRKHIYSEYKANRNGLRRPLILSAMRDHCLMEKRTCEYPWLEADDVMGILATSEDIEGNKIIATVDKDLMQIPVPVYNMDTKKIHKPEYRDCMNIFYGQMLAGDTIDNYPGCPGVGDATVDEILQATEKWEQYEHTFKSGKRKGLTETRWHKVPCKDLWEIIVSYFEKAGQTEEDAITQGQLAWILQAHNYNNKGQIIKWEPPHE